MKKRHQKVSTVTDAGDAIIYARVSSKDQEKEGYSIPAQLELLRSYAQSNGFQVIQEFTDVETAKAAGRNNFGQMLRLLEKNQNCRTLLVEKTDRLYRNLKDWVTIDDLGLQVHFVKENMILAPDSRSSEKFMHGIKVLMAKNYVDNLSEETRKGMIEKARQGMWPSYAPLGYRNVASPDGKRNIEPDPDLAPHIKRMFEWYATSLYSLKQIAQAARAEGFVYRKSRSAVPISTVHKILRNRIYSGDFNFDGVTYRGSYEPLITRELWKQVQSVLDGRQNKRSGTAKERFAFSGLITCGHCGCAMVAELKKGKYVYYHCTGYKGKCPNSYTREHVLEDKFTELLRGLVFTNDTLEWVRTALRDSHRDEREFRCDAITKLQREQKRLQERLEAMYEDKLDGRISGAYFDVKAAEIRATQEKLQRDLAAFQTANQNYIEDGTQLLELAQNAHLLFQQQPATEKRKLLNYVLSNCTWKDGELNANYRQPFDLLAVAVAADGSGHTSSLAQTGQIENWLPSVDSNHDSRRQRPLSYH